MKNKVSRQRNYQKRHKELGLCIICPDRAGPISIRLCERHRRLYNNLRNKRNAKKRKCAAENA